VYRPIREWVVGPREREILMDLAKLGKDDRYALVLAAVIVVTSLTSIIDEWGPGIIVALLAIIGVIFVVLQPQVAPTMKLPTTKEMAILVLSGVAALGFLLGALTYLNYILRFDRMYSIFFDVGLVASIALTYLAYLRYQRAGGGGGSSTAAS